jgi:hypothetical protein
MSGVTGRTNKVTIVFTLDDGPGDVPATWRMSLDNLIQAARLMGMDDDGNTMTVTEVRVVRPRV